MNDTFSNFLLGFLCTGTLFSMCYLIVVGAKIFLLAIKEKFTVVLPPPKIPPAPRKSVKKKRKPKSIPKPVRSIEIDPEQVDRIYVKKIS